MNEDIDTYWNSLDNNDRRWSKGEENHFRKFTATDLTQFGVPRGKEFSMLGDDSLKRLNASSEGFKTL